jgi:hypothetical protein
VAQVLLEELSEQAFQRPSRDRPGIRMRGVFPSRRWPDEVRLWLKEGTLRGTWKLRASVAGAGLALVAFAIVPTVAPLSKQAGDVAGRQETLVNATHESGSWSATPTGLGEGDDRLRFGPSSDSGGLSLFGCLGTVSHASIDNNFARLMEQARERCGTGSGSSR